MFASLGIETHRISTRPSISTKQMTLSDATHASSPQRAHPSRLGEPPPREDDMEKDQLGAHANRR